MQFTYVDHIEYANLELNPAYSGLKKLHLYARLPNNFSDNDLVKLINKDSKPWDTNKEFFVNLSPGQNEFIISIIQHVPYPSLDKVTWG